MRKKAKSNILSLVSFFICSVILLNTTAFAYVSSEEDMQTVESISIYPQFGIKKDESIQLEAEIEYTNSLFGAVEWISSNPSAISCTSKGLIKGIKPGESARITCKDKYGSVKDSITIYCVMPISCEKEYSMKNFLTFIYAQPFPGRIIDIHFDPTVLKLFFKTFFKLLAILGSPSINQPQDSFGITSGKCKVVGRIGDYCYIRYEGQPFHDGFVKYNFILGKVDSFLYINNDNMNVWADGTVHESYNLKADYSGNVTWTVSDPEIIQYDVNSHLVKGLKPGIATITAEADGMKRVCTVHSIYKWPLSWTGAAIKDTDVYIANGTSYSKSSTQLVIGEKFTVKGDMGNSDGWAYGVSESGTWGYVKIGDISLKGTISQYKNLGWTWPVATPFGKAQGRYISSPYGWRDTNPERHKGIDITNGTSSSVSLSKSIDGYNVVSAFAGNVIYVNSDTTEPCGNCVAIKSSQKDPVSGQYYVAIYMHMKNAPAVKDGQAIVKGQVVGKVGDTGNSQASHLHFEVNNQNLSYGDKVFDKNNKELFFDCHINPLFIYMNYCELEEDDLDKITINPDCDAARYRGIYWYGDDKKESKKP